MRTYATLSPTFWTRGSGKRLRGDLEAQVVALYLVTSPHANMTGIFSLSLPTLCHETGLRIEGARKGLLRCSEEQIAFYDEAEELAWVPAMARYQVGESLKVGKGGKVDKRVTGIKRALAPFKGHRFYDLFLERYAELYQLKDLITEGASESLPRDCDHDPDPDLVGGAGGTATAIVVASVEPALVDVDHETPLHPDFELHPAAVADLAERLGYSTEVILEAVNEFVGYWTIGGGANRKRRNWQSRCRDNILTKNREGVLAKIAQRLEEARAEAGEPKTATRWVLNAATGQVVAE